MWTLMGENFVKNLELDGRIACKTCETYGRNNACKKKKSNLIWEMHIKKWYLMVVMSKKCET